MQRKSDTEWEFLDQLTDMGILHFKTSLKSCLKDMIADTSPFYEVSAFFIFYKTVFSQLSLVCSY
jgi:ABC-type sulfate transport system substrate-binding protein